MYSVNCLHPILIINPRLRELALRCDKYIIDSNTYNITSSMRYDLLQNTKSISSILKLPFVHSLSSDFEKKLSLKEFQKCQDRLENFVAESCIFSSETGESYNIWQFVPCGHCDACNHTKLTSIVQRCQFSMEESKLPSLFVTLTYNSQHLPEDNKPCKRDVQLFKKRFVRCIKSHFSYNKDFKLNIKFLCVSEIGKKGRPHYHLFITGIPRLSTFDPEHDYFVGLALRYSWRVNERDSNGLFMSFKLFCKKFPEIYNVPKDYDNCSIGYVNFKEVSSSNVVSYITKYCFKQVDVDSKGDTFMLMSQNMGVQWLQNHAQSFNNNGKLQYFSHFDMSLKEVNLSAYYIKKLFPSISELIPSELRKNYLDVISYDIDIQKSCFLSKDIKRASTIAVLYLHNTFPYLHLFEDVIIKDYPTTYCFDSRLIDTLTQDEYDFLLRNFLMSFNKCLEYKDKIDYEMIIQRLVQRDAFFSKFKPRTFYQIYDCALKYRKQKLINQSKQKL